MDNVRAVLPSVEDGGFNDIYYEITYEELRKKKFS